MQIMGHNTEAFHNFQVEHFAGLSMCTTAPCGKLNPSANMLQTSPSRSDWHLLDACLHPPPPYGKFMAVVIATAAPP